MPLSVVFPFDASDFLFSRRGEDGTRERLAEQKKSVIISSLSHGLRRDFCVQFSLLSPSQETIQFEERSLFLFTARPPAASPSLVSRHWKRMRRREKEGRGSRQRMGSGFSCPPLQQTDQSSAVLAEFLNHVPVIPNRTTPLYTRTVSVQSSSSAINQDASRGILTIKRPFFRRKFLLNLCFHYAPFPQTW